MAQKTVVVVTDDLTGQTLPNEQGQTVRFALDGQDYEIDLTKENAAELRSAFQRYIDAGRRVGRQASTGRSGGGGVRPRQDAPARRPRDTAAVRAWARAHGHEISDRGRIPAKILEAYDAAG
jgi:Lsr2